MDAQDVQRSVRNDHPRLFFTAETWPTIEHHVRTREEERFRALRAYVDGQLTEEHPVDDHGFDAAKAAFIYRVTGDDAYAAFARDLLARSVEHYHERYEAERPVHWLSHSRIHAWLAYDWVHDAVPPDERSELAASFLRAVEQVQPTDDRESFRGENWSDHRSGFYGTRSLLWWAGVATHGDGVDDDLSAEFLRRGYDRYTDLLEHRSAAAGDVGGSASATLPYATGHYPWAEFNFFHTVESATGRDVASDWPYVALLPGYVFWNWLPGRREFGTGDAHHRTNEIWNLHRIHAHCSHVLHFYGDQRPREAAFAKWLRERLPREFHYDDLMWPLARFFMTEQRPDVEPNGPPTDLDTARHFPGMGQVFFRSGYGGTDTYASFTTGGQLSSHKHYDHGHFNVFKQGYLALDSGARAYPSNHLTHYYSRTAAHNCVLIRMPDEEMPQDYWGGPTPAPDEEAVPVPNDGGQREQLGSETVAFETTPEYAYAACDATDTYHEEKCALALRQFVYLPPDHFVIFDRVRAVESTYEKTWLLHTAAEPTLDGRTFVADHEEGRLLGRTILPRDADVTTVGGPGNRFVAGGRNWSLPEDSSLPETNPLYGQWRVEVRPDDYAHEHQFLHVLCAADQSREELAETSVVDDTDAVGVRIGTPDDCWTVTFGLAGRASGRVVRIDDGATVLDREFTRSVQSQSGLFD